MREQELQNLILEYLAYQKGKYWRINSGMIPAEKNGRRYMVRLAPKGFADIVGINDKGQFVAIEVKLPKKQPTEAQEHFLQTINNHGGLAFVARSLEDVQKHL